MNELKTLTLNDETFDSFQDQTARAELTKIPAVTGATVGQTVKIAAVDDDGAPTEWESVDFPDSGGNVDQSGLSATASALLITILRNGVYTSDQSANIDALEVALAAGGDTPDEPVEPDLPEVDVSQTESILSIVSGVTASQSGSVLAIA